MFTSNKDKASRDVERAGESLGDGDISGAAKDLKMGAAHGYDAATKDDRTVTEKIGDNISALGDKLTSASHSAQAEYYDAKAEASK